MMPGYVGLTRELINSRLNGAFRMNRNPKNRVDQMWMQCNARFFYCHCVLHLEFHAHKGISFASNEAFPINDPMITKYIFSTLFYQKLNKYHRTSTVFTEFSPLWPFSFSETKIATSRRIRWRSWSDLSKRI